VPQLKQDQGHDQVIELLRMSVDNVRIAYLNRQRFSGATAADQFLRIMQVEQPKT